MSASAIDKANTGSGVSAMTGLFRREMVHFSRQPSRIIAGVLTPLLIWGFLASGFAKAMTPGGDAAVAGAHGASYTVYLLPGTATLVAMFASIFAAMSLIEDRREGFLRSMLVSPSPRWSLVVAKTGAGAVFATLQAGVVLLAAPVVGAKTNALSILLAIALLAITSAALTAMGLSLAWKVKSSSGFHGVMNIVLMPMWLLSGAMFPLDTGAIWLKPVMFANPLYWSTQAIRGALAGRFETWPIVGAVAFLLAMIVFASVVIGRRNE